MPPQTNIAQTRFTNIIECLALSVAGVNQLCTVLDAPFLTAASSTTASLLVSVQTIKRNKDECTALMEHVHVVLQAIINLHIKSYAGDVLPLATLDQIGKFTETLQKISVFVEAQQDGPKIKHFFRQSETAALLKDCKAGLQNALDVFQVHNDPYVSNQITNMQVEAQLKHEALLKVITGLSDGSSSEISSMNGGMSSLQSSLISLSLLPAEPKIFHGREAEVGQIISVLIQEPARIAILGPGGIGKTSLARVVLHHPDITAKYQHRFFVTSESATTSSDLASLIGSTLDLKQQGQSLTTAIIQYFSDKPLCLLILDNLETPWESANSRGNVEEFLALLTDISNLALIVTMRGAERPSKVRWTRPFLAPLKPLTNEAARQTFIDITDADDDPDIKQLLSLTDNMPLAIDLIAHLAAYESCSVVLSRWEKDKTSLLSSGYDRESNLDVSIALSLSSPRMSSSPGALQLLSLLSVLPDGLSNNELLQSHLPIQDILASKATLLRTSLAYVDRDLRLKTLVPIRDYMHRFHPAQSPLVNALRTYYHELLELYTRYNGSPSGARVVDDIKLNFGNLQSILLLGLKPDNPHLEQTVYCTLSFNAFTRRSGGGLSTLMAHISPLAPQLEDHKLHVLLIAEMFDSYVSLDVPNPEDKIQQALEHLNHFDDGEAKSKFYMAAGTYYYQHLDDVASATKFFESALSLSRSCGDANGECSALFGIAHITGSVHGDFITAKKHAHEMARVAKLCGNLNTEARAVRLEARCLSILGDYKDSIELYERAMRLLDVCGLLGTDMTFIIMQAQAQVHLEKSEYVEAREILAQILQKFSESPQQSPHRAFRHADVLLITAIIDIATGAQPDDINHNIERAKSVYKTRDSGIIPFNILLADLALSQGHTTVAKTQLQNYLNLVMEKSSPEMVDCLERLGDISCWNPDEVHSMSSWTILFLVYTVKNKLKPKIHQALRCLGDIFVLKGDEDTACSLFTTALDGFTHMDVHRGRGDCMLRLGDIAKHQGNSTKAVEMWTAARPLFERSSQAKDVKRIDDRLSV